MHGLLCPIDLIRGTTLATLRHSHRVVVIAIGIARTVASLWFDYYGRMAFVFSFLLGAFVAFQSNYIWGLAFLDN